MALNIGGVLNKTIIQESVLKTAKLAVKGSDSARGILADKVVTNFTIDLAGYTHGMKEISANKLQALFEKHFPSVNINLAYNLDTKTAGKTGILSNTLNESACGYEMLLPFENINGEAVLKLTKKNLLTLFHETTHLSDFCHKPKLVATQIETNRYILKKVDQNDKLSPKQKVNFKNFAKQLNEIKHKFRDMFYSNESDNYAKFALDYKAGKATREAAVEARLGAIKKGIEPIEESFRKIGFAIQNYKFALQNMIIEHNAFANEKIQAKIYQTSHLLVDATLRKLGTNNLEMLNTPEAKKIMKDLLKNTDRKKILQQVANKVEEDNNMYYLFPEKIQFLKEKLAQEIQFRRNEIQEELAEAKKAAN